MAAPRSTEPGLLRVVGDLLRARRGNASGIARRQSERLPALISHARTNSLFYQRLYAGLPSQPALEDLPPVTKQQLMAAFDDWVCDPAVTLAGVRAFVAGSVPAGTEFLGRYFVCSTSGTTGHPGLFVHDRHACVVYEAMSVPIDMAWLSGWQWVRMLHRRARWAVVVGTGGHFAGEGWIAYLARRHWWRHGSWRSFSLQMPLPELVSELNEFGPVILTSYPSALEVLAGEQSAGRLRLRPAIVELGGESIDPAGRARIADAFGETVVHNAYAASECLLIAFDCREGWLHVNADWAILEPVEADYSPTPPGRRSHTVLLTNLANRVQPIIRYDLGDSITARTRACPCGSPLPAIRVEGRSDDVLHLRTTDGGTVSVLPLAVGTVIDETPGVQRSQLVQTGPSELTLRLDISPGAVTEQVWSQACADLSRYLTAQGLPDVAVIRAAEGPQRSPTSAKFRQVIARQR